MKGWANIKGKSAALLLLVLLAMACGRKKNGIPEINLKPTFSISDKNPLGLYAAHRLLKMTFPDYEIKYNSKPFKEFFTKFTQYDASRSKNIFAIISKQFYPNQEDVEAMFDFVKNGNTLFIASNCFDTSFLEKFNLETNDPVSLQTMMNYMMDMSETGVSMSDSAMMKNDPYRFFFYPMTGAIRRDTSLPSTRIVNTDLKLPGAVVFRKGSGRVIVVMNATAFTNYFLLTKNNYQYLLNLMSYMPRDANDITWDSYYNRSELKRDSDYSDFQELMKYPPLRWAFWLFILGGLLLVVMGLIRRQRMIPVIKPNVNSSVEFGETVARLYLLKRDNKNIASKMITYFLERVRSKYYISTSTLNQEFAQTLAAKSGAPIENVLSLLRTIEQVQSQERISDEMLMTLNAKINLEKI